MKQWVQILIIFLTGLAFLLIMGVNAKNYDNRQNKTQNTLIEQLY